MGDYFAKVPRKKLYNAVEYSLHYLMTYHINNFNVEQFENCITLAENLRLNKSNPHLRAPSLKVTREHVNRSFDIYFDQLKANPTFFRCVKYRLKINHSFADRIAIK